MNDLERLPCGCAMGTVKDAFVMEPCSETCEYYAYVVEETRKSGKPITTVDTTAIGQINLPATCPFCGGRADGFSGGRDLDAVPHIGDVAICTYCTRAAFYTETCIRKPSEEEQAELDADSHIQAMRTLMKRDR